MPAPGGLLGMHGVDMHGVDLDVKRPKGPRTSSYIQATSQKKQTNNNNVAYNNQTWQHCMVVQEKESNIGYENQTWQHCMIVQKKSQPLLIIIRPGSTA